MLAFRHDRAVLSLSALSFLAILSVTPASAFGGGTWHGGGGGWHGGGGGWHGGGAWHGGGGGWHGGYGYGWGGAAAAGAIGLAAGAIAAGAAAAPPYYSGSCDPNYGCGYYDQQGGNSAGANFPQ